MGNINLVPIEESERRDETENQVSENSGLSYEEFSSALRSASLSLSQFSVEERSLFQTVNVCSECGSSSFFDSCDEDECKAIGLKLQRNCVFENNNLWFGGDCVYQNVLETEEEIILRSEDSIEIFYESFELNVQDNSQIQVPLMIDSIEFDQDSSICEFDSLMNEICRPLDTNDVSNVFEYNEEDIVVEVLNPYQVSQDNLIFTPYMFLHPDSAGVLEISDISIIDSLIVTESDSIEPVENVEVEITLPDSSVVGGISDSLGMIEVEVSLNPDSIQGTEILNELREEFTFDSAINYILANNLFGDYSDSLKNEEFVEWIYSDGLINSEEYRDIIGKGLFNSEEDMEFVEVLLLEKILIGQEIIESSEVIQEQLEDSICSADTSSKECEEIIVTEVNKVEEEVCTKKDSLEECVVKLEVFIPENFGLFLEEIPKTLTGKTIVIDPGHGGYDSGAVGFGEIYESNLALSYSLLLKSELEKRGATIYMTRNSDVGIGTDQQSSLAKRKEFTKEKNPDYFVSVHFNSVENSSKKINKTEILIRGLAKENTVGVLDSCLIEDCKSYHSPSNSLAKVIKGNLRGVSEIIIFGSDVNVLYDNGADKSILYEINYINHEEMVEYVQVDSVKEKYVGAIVQAMIAENNFDESGSCTNYESCQKILGESVYSIASSSAKEKGISDSKILEETGFKSFGCLILGIAMQESSIRHCEGFFSEGNPLYCDESRENVLVSSSEDIGVMQIHSNPLIPAYVDPYDFYDNVGYASTLFNDKYLSGLKYPGGREYTCLDKTYSGWNLALRYYNGWSPKDCSKGDKDYVENVLSHSDEIESLFPELCSV